MFLKYFELEECMKEQLLRLIEPKKGLEET